MQYLSNNDKQVYTISNLKEEVIATIFAYVSRSPKSFRENLTKVTEEKASKFHEKWVLNYGHASVAEHATIHFGIEKVSRLFSSILARSNLYFSITEYSQRYQKVGENDFYIPNDLNKKIKTKYINFHKKLYTEYINIFNRLNEIGKNEKIAFENARSVLSLATYTNLGLTSNARALENSLTIMLSSKHKEVVEIADMMKAEAFTALPTLVKYARKNDYFISVNNYLSEFYKFNKRNFFGPGESLCELIDFPNYDAYEYFNLLVKKLLKLGIKKHDPIPSFFDNFIFRYNLKMSEACYHQFLRHRSLNIVTSEPSIDNGYLIPKKIDNDNYAKEHFLKAMDDCEKFHIYIKNLKKISDGYLSNYLVTNAHIRLVNVKLTLKDIFHLINLRMTKEAQPEIHSIVKKMVNEIKKIYPSLINPFLESTG